MEITDQEHFISETDWQDFKEVLQKQHLSPHDFSIEITEDQDEMSMEDLEYVIMLYVKITYLPSAKTRTYISPQNSGLWIKELEDDLDFLTRS